MDLLDPYKNYGIDDQPGIYCSDCVYECIHCKNNYVYDVNIEKRKECNKCKNKNLYSDQTICDNCLILNQDDGFYYCKECFEK